MDRLTLTTHKPPIPYLPLPLNSWLLVLFSDIVFHFILYIVYLLPLLAMSKESKALLRKSVTELLRSLDSDLISQASQTCSSRVVEMEVFQRSESISVYLSMPKEVQTLSLLKRSFEMRKRVFIPKVIGPGSEDMLMVELTSLEEIDSFPRNKWGIPEPQGVFGSRDDLPDIDLVVVPGVAFDACCRRLGHGKGYYDCFLDRLQTQRSSSGRPPSTTIVSLAESPKATTH